MTKSNIAIFFSLIFMSLIIVPPIMSMFNNDYEISAFIDLNEEESKGFEAEKTIELLAFNTYHPSFGFEEFKTTKSIGYIFKTYPKAHLNLISPPPERNIL